MKANFESPVHTARDLVERDITLFMGPGNQIWKQMLLQSDFPEYRIIGENMIILNSWDHFYAMTKNEMLVRGTHAMMRPSLTSQYLVWAKYMRIEKGEYKYEYNHGRGYYRGEKVGGMIPEGGYLTHKKWHLNEVEN